MAEGRVIQGYVVVTDRRLIWTEGRRFLSLPFDRAVRAQQIFEETHRYRLTLTHEPIDRERDAALPWDIPRHLGRLRARKTWNRVTQFRFSRADTEAAEALRRALSRAGVPFAPAVVRPHHREQGVAYLQRMGSIRAWWYRRRFSGLD